MWDEQRLGQVPYEPTWQAMRQFALQRPPDQPNALWICEHPPTFTQGLAGRAEHVLATGDIPLVATDRGGQVTYHGPGQVVAYPLLDLRRAGYFVKEYVYRLEEATLRTLADWQVVGHRVRGAPGIYVRLDDPHKHTRLADGFGSEQLGAPHAPERLGKVAALGIKVARHCTYHGLSLNVAMNLEPFSRINPCGYQGLQTVDLATIGVNAAPAAVADRLAHHLCTLLEP